MKKSQTQSGFKGQKTPSIGSQIREKILLLDAFGCPVQLLVKKNEQHQTFYGGCFTFCISFLAAFYFYTMMANMVNKGDPNIVTSEYYNEQPELVVLSKEKFTMAFAMEDAYTFLTYQNTSLFSVVLQNCKKENVIDPKTGLSGPVFSCRDIPMENCTLENHVNIPDLKNYYSRLALNTLYCIKSDVWEKEPPVIQGDFDSNIFQWLRLTVNSCKNETGVFESCAPQEEINDKLSAGYMAIYFTDTIHDPQNPDHPSTIVGKDVFTTFSNKLSKEMNIFMKHTYLKSDDGYITSDFKEYHDLSYGFSEELLDTRIKGDFLNVVFRLDKKYTGKNLIVQNIKVTYRSYIKFQDVLGNLGGLWQFLLVLGVFLVIPVNKLDLQLKILNNVFSFEVESNIQEKNDEQVVQQIDNLDSNRQNSSRPGYSEKYIQSAYLQDDEVQNQQKSDQQKQELVIKFMKPTPKDNSQRVQRQQTQKVVEEGQQTMDPKRRASHKATFKVYSHLRNFMNNKGSMSLGGQKRNEKKMNEMFRNYFKLNLGKLTLQTYEYVVFFFSCIKSMKKKQDQINFAIKKLDKQIDVLQLLKKLTELEKLKMLILTPQQLKLFDYLPKPCIPKEDSHQTMEEKFSMLQSDEKQHMSYWSIIQSEKTVFQRASEAFQAYEFIQSKKYKSPIDEKLIKFLDSRIKTLFDMGIDPAGNLKESIANKKNTHQVNIQFQQDAIVNVNDSESDNERGQNIRNQFDEQNQGIDVLNTLTKRSKNK